MEATWLTRRCSLYLARQFSYVGYCANKKTDGLGRPLSVSQARTVEVRDSEAKIGPSETRSPPCWTLGMTLARLREGSGDLPTDEEPTSPFGVVSSQLMLQGLFRLFL